MVLSDLGAPAVVLCEGPDVVLVYWYGRVARAGPLVRVDVRVAYLLDPSLWHARIVCVQPLLRCGQARPPLCSCLRVDAGGRGIAIC